MKLKSVYIQNMLFEVAKSEDLEDIVTIYNQAIANKIATAELTPTSVGKKQSWFSEHLQDDNRPMYVLRDIQSSGKVIAWASYSDLFKRVAYRISSELSIYIHDDYQKQGLGKEMIRELLSLAPDLGMHNILVKVFAHNKASLSLFENFGFQQWGYLPKVCDMDGFIADVVIMGKRMIED